MSDVILLAAGFMTDQPTKLADKRSGIMDWISRFSDCET